MSAQPLKCIVCKTSKGKIACDCQCNGANIHKKCIPSLALRLYKRKRDSCDICKAKISCVKRQHFFKATRSMLKNRIKYTDIYFTSKNGIIPMHMRRRDSSLSDFQKSEIQQKWEQLIDEELSNCPEFAKKPLQNARKHQVKFTVSYGCKWD